METATADLTEVLDPAELYGDRPCPPWPYVPPGYPHHIASGRQAAEAALEKLRALLHPSGGDLRQPTSKERESLKASFFAPMVPQHFEDPDEAAWKHRHGVSGLTPRHRGDRRTDAIVEAAHIRAYLRQLETEEARSAERQAASETARARLTLDQSVEQARTLAAEYEALKEAEARHLQHCADERAFYRANEIKRQQMPGLASAIRAAANKLGESVPEMPVIE